jgi:hypothetical protein
MREVQQVRSLNFFRTKKLQAITKNALQNDNQIALSEETAKLLLAKIIKIALQTLVQDNNNKSYIITAVYKLPNANTVFKPVILRFLKQLRKIEVNGRILVTSDFLN